MSNNKQNEQTNVYEDFKKVKVSDIYYDNYWSKSIVVEIVDTDVPIPEGFEYVQGTKETGVIIKDLENNDYLLWIPYEQNVTTDTVQEYYENHEDVQIDVDVQESINKYGGFYIMLEKDNKFELLKGLDDVSYQQAYKKVSDEYKDSSSVNSHLVYKKELAQIMAYGQKIGLEVDPLSTLIMENDNSSSSSDEIKIKDYNIGIQALSVNLYDSVNSQQSIILESNEGNVAVPEGFEKCVSGVGVDSDNETGIIVKIRDKDNIELRYVWVPIEKSDMQNAFSTVRDYYTSLNIDFWHDDAKDEQNNDLEHLMGSVAKYGGFYIGEAELGYNDNGEVINKARGMKKDQETGHPTVNVGSYLRGTDAKTYENALQVASDIHKDNSKVTSHLMYGAEWDATMIWLLNSNVVTKEQLVKDSSNVSGAKYKGTIELDENGGLKDDNLEGLNGIYGLAGNLVEVTQENETVDGKIARISRGGSYLYTGEYLSMLSRLAILDEDIQLGEDIGFRNCLYINLTKEEQEQYEKDKENEEKNDNTENTENSDEGTKYLKYTFAYENVPGSAQGQIDISNLSKDGVCQLYWGNDQDILQNYSQFATVTITGGSGTTTIEKAIAIPSGATKIYAYMDGQQLFRYSIPTKQQFSYNYKYSFGALSDVHYNGGGNERFAKILQWYTSQNVAAVMAAGDISGDDQKDITENVSQAIECVASNLGNNIRFYSSKGNHDKISNEYWNKNLFNIDDNSISYSQNCYVVEIQNDLFIMVHSEEKGVSMDALNDLEKILSETYDKYEKIYIFEHIFLANTSGELYNSSGEPIATTYVMPVGSAEDTKFREILRTYKDKVIMFSGHSHWKYDHQIYNSDLNIYNGQGEYAMMAHISSLLCPRILKSNGEKEADYSSSEAMIVEVYDKAVVLKALNVIPLMNGNSSPEYEAYASYIIYF